MQTHIAIGDVLPLVDSIPRSIPVGDLRPAILAYLKASNGEVQQLYALDKAAPFDVQTVAPEDKQFTAARLAAGAQMLRDLWYSAWLGSAPVTITPATGSR